MRLIGFFISSKIPFTRSFSNNGQETPTVDYRVIIEMSALHFEFKGSGEGSTMQYFISMTSSLWIFLIVCFFRIEKSGSIPYY